MDKQAITKAFLEGLKEVLRVAVIASIPVVIDGLSKGALSWQLMGTAAAIAILKALDKMLHEYGKETGSDGLTKGLVRF